LAFDDLPAFKNVSPCHSESSFAGGGET
jgi:hypothetical protein